MKAWKPVSVLLMLLLGMVTENAVMAGEGGEERLQLPNLRNDACERFVRGPDYERYLRLLETGDAEALNLARKLRCCVDGAYSLDLDFALARALVAAPEAVALLLETDFPVRRVCIVPMIEAPAQDEAAFARRAVAALRQVPRPTPAVRDCIQRYRAVLEGAPNDP